MNGILDGKVVIVTGGGQGVGKAIAEGLAAEGAKVVVNDIGVTLTGEAENASVAEEVAGAIRARGGEAVSSTESIVDWDAAQSIVQSAVDQFGRVDMVVNNAGILRDAIFHRMEPDQFRAVLEVHLFGSFNISRAAAPHFKAQQAGSLVHMTSTAGLIGNFGQANYMAAKMGIVGLSRAIAMDMQRFNVRSNCIAPFAWSRMVGSIPTETEADRDRVAKLKRMTPEKITPLVAFLGSDAAAEISGQIFSVRNNEVYLFNQPRPIRTLHSGSGWTAKALAEILPGALKTSLTPLERSADVISWDPV
ncbi:SDR family NAD(P)-dependent oxidoreductase [Rhizobium sp. SSA_523]|uniref:SDR family NAD(P)-dependent oxidoreductase n=1 Tax=Rhizobium sp. SSA_523 TaxID=2952477 RepID=UPI002090E6C2|nr:SDR family NAD(P)-dependent oxidoreductase [Rhizobium sp. SSA_523]MCO5731646.1 SDR family NAD(P)-dependent oxidoreductase [Rhizobium sp. SSA_523]WKC21848.1 SDR family NAD(P)-dependent oxidoreductase [Rhizobium sp. SSA_523]